MDVTGHHLCCNLLDLLTLPAIEGEETMQGPGRAVVPHHLHSSGNRCKARASSSLSAFPNFHQHVLSVATPSCRGVTERRWVVLSWAMPKSHCTSPQDLPSICSARTVKSGNFKLECMNMDWKVPENHRVIVAGSTKPSYESGIMLT